MVIQGFPPNAYVLLTHTLLWLQSTLHPSESGAVSITAVLASVYVGGLERSWWDLAWLCLSAQMAMERSTALPCSTPQRTDFFFSWSRTDLTLQGPLKPAEGPSLFRVSRK